MPFLEELGIHATTNLSMALAGPAIGVAAGLLGGGPFRSAAIGAIGGAIAGAVTNDSYSTTDAARNALLGGAIGGLGGGLSKFLIPRTPGMIGAGAKALFRNKNIIARGTTGLARTTGKAGIGAVKFAFKHPILTGGVLAGGYMGTAMASRNPQMMDFDFSDSERVEQGSWRSFQDSSTGLTLGLHSRRHR